MSLTNAAKHQRIQESLLAPLESRILRFFARIMPRWVNSDHLTALGLFGMLVAGVFYYMSQWNPVYLYLVNLAIAVNWFGDSLDGTLARHRNRQRPRYGYYVDHILDSFGALALVAGLSLSGLMSERVAAGFLVAYLLLNIHIYLATTATGRFKISFGLVGPTELRVGLMIGNLFLIGRPTVGLFGHHYLLFDIGGVLGIVVLAGILVFSTIRVTRELYCLERFE